MAKNKAKQQAKARQKRARVSKERQKRKKGRRADGVQVPGEHLPPLTLDWVRPERLLPPVHVDRTGAAVPDPWSLLGLPADERDPEAIRRAWREQTVAHPPEAEPELARQIREARDRLTEPDRLLERELAVLRAPDAAAWGLSAEIPSSDPDRLDIEARLTGQAVLYALVEDELLEQGLQAWLDEAR